MMRWKTMWTSPDYRRIAEQVLFLGLGAGAGIGLMYLYDARRGLARRNRLADRASALFRRAERGLEKHGLDLLNRTRGVLAETEAALAPESVADEALVAHVRARMGHVVANSHRIRVYARNGAVTFEGQLSHAEKRRLRKEVEAIPGVTRVYGLGRDRPGISPALLIGLAFGIAGFARASGRRQNAPE